MHVVPLPLRTPRDAGFRAAVVGDRLWYLNDPTRRGRTQVDVHTLDGTFEHEFRLNRLVRWVVADGPPVLCWTDKGDIVTVDSTTGDVAQVPVAREGGHPVRGPDGVVAFVSLMKPTITFRRLSALGAEPIGTVKFGDRVECVVPITASRWLVATDRRLSEVVVDGLKTKVIRSCNLPRTPRAIVLEESVVYASDEAIGGLSGATLWRVRLEDLGVERTREGLRGTLVGTSGGVVLAAEDRLLTLDESLVEFGSTSVPGLRDVAPLGRGCAIASTTSGPVLIDFRV